MRRVVRLPLPPAATMGLARLTAEVKSSPEPVNRAAELWRKKPKATFDEVRGALEAMATGRGRCMNCEDSLGTDIEHFYPKARYPRRAFSWTNYLLACSHCNSNLKRQRFPFLDRRPALLDPTTDDPLDHLLFIPSTGELCSTGPKGLPSIDVFGLNDSATPRKLPRARRETFLKLQLLLEEYERCLAARDEPGATLAKQAIVDEPFLAVLGWLIRIAAGPAASDLLRPGVAEIVVRRGIATWV